MDVDILNRKSTNFVLWAPGQTTPKLSIGVFTPGAPPTVPGRQSFSLNAVAGVSGLFEISPAACGLTNNTVYHYWFEVDDTNAGHLPGARILVSDPIAFTTDWRLTEGAQPASVIKFAGGRLVPCDPDGTEIAPAAVPNVAS